MSVICHLAVYPSAERLAKSEGVVVIWIAVSLEWVCDPRSCSTQAGVVGVVSMLGTGEQNQRPTNSPHGARNQSTEASESPGLGQC
eukprot:COSAG01_NODE_5349_length_4316_cov_33.342898_1_plen_86_part_00